MAFNKHFLLLITMLFVILFSPYGTQKLYAQEPSQTEVDESFDPFSDYNEYEQQSEEEEDIYFLRNGRYLTLAFIGGYRGFVGGGFADAYTGSLTYGLEFTYFFNMQLAGAISYQTGDNNVNFASYSDPTLSAIKTSYSGTVNIQHIDFHMKYYFNTDNVTKGLADLNPYGLAGVSYNIRTYSLDKILPEEDDRIFGFKAGAGIEIPLLKRKAYMGFQAVYRYVQFPDENKTDIEEGTGPSSPIKPRLNGDIFDLSILLGLNF